MSKATKAPINTGIKTGGSVFSDYGSFLMQEERQRERRERDRQVKEKDRAAKAAKEAQEAKEAAKAKPKEAAKAKPKDGAKETKGKKEAAPSKDKKEEEPKKGKDTKGAQTGTAKQEEVKSKLTHAEILGKVVLGKLEAEVKEVERQFPTRFDLHWNAISTFLETHTTRFPTSDTAFAGNLFKALPKGVLAFIDQRHQNSPKEVVDHLLNTLAHSLLSSSATAAPKDQQARTLGTRALLQYLVYKNPAPLRPLIGEMDTFHPNFRVQVPICKEVGWIYVQAISSDPNLALDGWEKLLYPSLLEPKVAATAVQALAIDVLEEISELVLQGKKEKRYSSFIRVHAKLYDLQNNNQPLASVKREAEYRSKLKSVAERLNAQLLKASWEDSFEIFLHLSAAKYHPFQKEYKDRIVQSLRNHPEAFELWQFLYDKNIAGSQFLLKVLAEDWEKTKLEFHLPALFPAVEKIHLRNEALLQEKGKKNTQEKVIRENEDLAKQILSHQPSDSNVALTVFLLLIFNGILVTLITTAFCDLPANSGSTLCKAAVPITQPIEDLLSGTLFFDDIKNIIANLQSRF